MEVADLVVKLRADSSGMKTGMQQAESSVSSFQKSVQNMIGALAGLGLAAIGKQIAQVGIEFLALKEQAQIAFTTLLGSGQMASSFLRELESFAARTPFEFPDLLRAAQRLTAMGFAARDVIPMLTAIGDAAAAMGASSATIDRITLALGQMSAKGKVSHEEMRQLAEVGIPVWQILADKIGKTVPEAMKLAEKGMLDGKKAVKDLIDGIQNGTQNVQAFSGMMDKQSKTVQGLASTLKDLGRQALGDILTPAFEKLRGVMAKVVEVLPQVVDWFQRLDSDIKNGVLAFGALLTVGPLVIAGLGLVGTALGALLSPIGAIVAALGVLGIAYASNLGGIRDAINEFASVVAGIWSNHGTEMGRITAETWSLISEQVRDNFHRISEVIKAGSAVMQGDWKRAGQGLIETTLSFTVSMGDIIFNFTSRLLPKWLNNALISIRDFAINTARALVGIEGPQLDFKAPNNVPGLPSWEVIAQSDRALQGLAGTLPKVGGAARSAKKELTELQRAMLDIVQAIDDGLSGGDKIGRALQNTIAPVIDTLKKKTTELAAITRTAGDAIVNFFGLAIDKTMNKVLIYDQALEEHIQWIRKLQKEQTNTAKAMEASRQEFEAWGDVFRDLSATLPRAWNTILDSVIQDSGRMGIDLLKFGVKVKGIASDIINVFDTLPGKWGQSLNRALDEINKWVNFLDAAIKLVQRMMGDEQTGLGGIVSSIAGVFKKTTTEIQASSEDWAGSLERMSTGVSTQMTKAATGAEAGAGRMVAAFGQIAGAALAFIGAKGQGVVGGAFSGALGGIAAAGGIATALGVALSPLTLGLSAAGGALLGGLIGLFTGKSAEQKAAEARQLEQAKISLQQTAQNVINAAIQGFDSALKFFENLDEFTAPRKAKFQEFWKAMTRLMNGFLDMAKTWASTSLAQAKALSESIGPIAQAISALPEAFTAINGHFSVAQSSIDSFFADFSKIMDAFFIRSEIWIDGISKRAMKVANRLSPVVALISAFGTAMSDLTGVKEPSDEMFGIFDRTIDKIVTHVANLSLKFDKAVLKTMANFAEKAGAALSIWKEAIDSIRATIDVPVPSESSIDNVVAGIEMFVAKLSESVGRMVTTDLARVAAFVQTITPIAAAIKAWAETAEVVRGYAAIAADVWQAIVSDFERGLTLLTLLTVDAELYVEKATKFKDLIDKGASLITAAIQTYSKSITDTASAMLGTLPGSGVPMSAAMAPVPAAVGALSRSSMAPSAVPVQLHVHIHTPSIVTEATFPELIAKGIQQGEKRGIFSKGLLGNGSLQVA